MEDGGIDPVRVGISSALLFLVLVGNVRLLVYTHQNIPSNSSLRNVLAILCVSALFAGITGFSGILMSAWPDGPLINKLSCEVFGALDHVCGGGANWMLAIIAMERYMFAKAPTEHSSTFSLRNLKILAAGLYILQIMIDVGPFYGLGEYTVMRGKLTLFVTFNMTSTEEIDGICTVEEMVSLLRQRYIQLMPQRIPDPTFTGYHYLVANHHVLLARARWVDDGLVYVMRMPNATILESFWDAYTSGYLNQRMSALVYSPQVIPTLENHLPNVLSYLNVDDYLMLKNAYLPLQELGICDGDFTSVNQHSDIWMAYNLLLTALLPCAISVVCFSAVCVLHYRDNIDKTDPPEDMYLNRALTIVSWLSMATHLAYIVVNIMFARGTFFQPSVILGVGYIVHSSRFLLYFVWCLVDTTPLHVLRGIGMIFFRVFSKASVSLRSDNRPRRSYGTNSPTPVSL